MHLRRLLFDGGFISALILFLMATSVFAGTLGYPAPRQDPLHLRFELVGDSFQENLHSSAEGDAKAKSGRGLMSIALGLTKWAEVYGRIGMAEFSVRELLFNGEFGLAYGGGVRFRLLKLPFGVLGLTGQYLRFTSQDDNSASAQVEGEWEEFDAALGVGTGRAGLFQFYAGVAYHQSDVTLKEKGATTRTTLESDIPFRLFIGVHLYALTDVPSGNLIINVEARMIGETPQFTLGAQYAF